ncbi:uncharacterized protein PV09_00096 [Verruconis gallopava]|uniref:Uncharacterized protein n=1 Tax=Verruconis gallopava TaxID=253628 RepID=A0A0D1Y285_9PEZI|nr:uncharacterized protein PV09_00096 [Verruconis gallopava]KIW09161.1 hypothetical protein PV09_00096 [Verruconis gallopava]
MQLQFVTLDVFTDRKFVGNPLAVIHLPSSAANLPQDTKQAIAREFNLSEIVFLHEQTEDDIKSSEARIDIFTALAEVPFAGHPTIGTGVYVLECLQKTDILALRTKAGRKTISKTDRGVSVALAHEIHVHDKPFAGLAFDHHPVVSIVKGMNFILVKLPDLVDLATQDDNLVGMRNCYTSYPALDEGWREGLLTTFYYVDLGVDADSGRRKLRTRAFGAREDPGTGSASAALSAYLSLTENGPTMRKFHLTQGVEMGRQCDIFVDVIMSADGGIESVSLSGVAVMVMKGNIDVEYEPEAAVE